MPAAAPDPLPFATQKVPETLVDRIKCQNGREKLDLTLCSIVKIPIQAISENYEGTPVYLDLSFNQICFVAPQFSRNFINLTKLDLGRNNIKRLPDNFGLMQGLVYLDIRRNQLETLPVSMGKMKRLRFLCLSDNPFRPHLKDFLGERASEITPVALAELVIHFLEEFATAHTQPEPPQSVSRSNASLGKRRSLKIHYSSRSLRMAGDFDSISSFSSDGNPNEVSHVNNPFGKAHIQSKEASSDVDKLPGMTFMIAAGILILTVLFTGYIVETPFFDSLAGDYPFFEPFWMWYKPVHEVASLMTNWIPKNSAYVFTAPPLNTLERSLSVLGKVKQSAISVGIWLKILSPS